MSTEKLMLDNYYPFLYMVAMNPLKAYAEKKELTISQLARICGLPQSTMWRIAHDKVVASPRVAKQIEQALNGAVSRNELLYPNG